MAYEFPPKVIISQEGTFILASYCSVYVNLLKISKIVVSHLMSGKIYCGKLGDKPTNMLCDIHLKFGDKPTNKLCDIHLKFGDKPTNKLCDIHFKFGDKSFTSLQFTVQYHAQSLCVAVDKIFMVSSQYIVMGAFNNK